MRKRPKGESTLCVILDRDFLSEDGIVKAARRCLLAGADMIQLRGKKSSTIELLRIGGRLKKLAKKYGRPLIVNDRKGLRSPRGIRFLKKMKRLGIPFLAIGGIDLKNVRKLTEAGFRDIAVVRAICRSRDPYLAAKKLKEAIG